MKPRYVPRSLPSRSSEVSPTPFASGLPSETAPKETRSSAHMSSCRLPSPGLVQTQSSAPPAVTGRWPPPTTSQSTMSHSYRRPRRAPRSPTASPTLSLLAHHLPMRCRASHSPTSSSTFLRWNASQLSTPLTSTEPLACKSSTTRPTLALALALALTPSPRMGLGLGLAQGPQGPGPSPSPRPWSWP